MENINKISKIFLFIAIGSSFIWLGSFIARMMAVFQIYEGRELVYKEYLAKTPEVLEKIFITINPIFILSDVSIAIAILFLILFILTGKINFRNEGWLVIAIAIACFIAIYEAVLFFLYDWKIIFPILSNNFSYQATSEIIKERIKAAGGFTIIAPLAYFLAAAMFFYKPFRKSSRKDEN